MTTVEGSAPPATGQGFGGLTRVPPVRAQVPAVPKAMTAVALLAVIVVAGLIVLLGFMLPTGQPNQARAMGFRIGRTFMSLLVPLLLAYVFAGRKSARKPVRFALVFCLAGVFFVGVNLFTSGGLANSFETPEQHIGRLMREAAGLEAVHESLFPGRRHLDDTLREQFRLLVQQNREYAETVDKMDISQVKYINSPESFADPTSASGALKQLHDLYDADAEQEAKVKEIVSHLRTALESSAGSAGERETLLRGFDSGMAPQRAKRLAVVAAEKGWMDAVDDEYDFAVRHAGKLRLSQGHLVIDDPAVREEFNAKLRFQESQRKAFLDAQKDFTQSQSESLQKMGVNPKDVGAK